MHKLGIASSSDPEYQEGKGQLGPLPTFNVKRHSMGNDLTDQAIRLREKFGLPMVPSKGERKIPCVRWKVFQNRLPTTAQIRQWAKTFRPGRWGFVTGQLSQRVVIDFDGDEGQRLMKKWGIKPHLRTGSGGFHWHVAHPGWPVPTLNAKTGTKSWPWPGVDIRGDGGFAVVLGRNSSGPYEILRDLVPEPFESLPEEVRKFLQDHSTTEKTDPKPPPRPHPATDHGNRVDLERLIEKALDLSSDGRNNAGFWLACQLRDNGYAQPEAESALRCYGSRVSSTNTKGKREPYTVRELLASLEQAYSRPARDSWKKKASRPHSNAASAASRSPGPRRGEDRSSPRKEMPRPGDCADHPDSMGLYVGYPGRPQVGYPYIPLSSRKYAKVPGAVFTDPRLDAKDVRVYCVISSRVFQGSVATVGRRQIAKEACCAECTVGDRLRRLELTGHVRIVPVARGRRGIYHLVSPAFDQKQRNDVQEVITMPSGHRRLATVRKDQGRAWAGTPAASRRSKSK